LSGDFTWKASRDEFLFAKNFVDNLRTWVASKSGQLVVCPGNHDLKWTKDPSNKQKKVDVAGEEARKEYVRFYRELFYQDPNDFMTMGRRLLLDRAFPVEIASLNSSFLQQEKEHFQGHGFTGENQRRQVAQKMDWESENKNPRTIRIVVVHHDVLPTSFTDRLQKEAPYSLMLDAEGLLQWATELRVDVILHGHKHQPAYNALRRPHPIGDTHTIHVVGMGSAGVKSDHLAEIRQNVVGVLTFEENQLRCDTFFVRPNAPAEKSDSHSYLLSLSTL
jgi:3',5'-cyclic AMP phosphodiesterase CpdA